MHNSLHQIDCYDLKFVITLMHAVVRMMRKTRKKPFFSLSGLIFPRTVTVLSLSMMTQDLDKNYFHQFEYFSEDAPSFTSWNFIQRFLDLNTIFHEEFLCCLWSKLLLLTLSMTIKISWWWLTLFERKIEHAESL